MDPVSVHHCHIFECMSENGHQDDDNSLFMAAENLLHVYTNEFLHNVSCWIRCILRYHTVQGESSGEGNFR
jgi:hypothetical protein